MQTKRRFVVLGGAGTIGRVVVRDLFESCPDNNIVVADYNEPLAQSLAKSLSAKGGKDNRVQAKFADARQLKDLVNLLNGQNVVINCLQHTFNLTVMEAAWCAETHYVDLGGLFSYTRKQLRLNKKFQNAGLTAVIGMGCSPGITNVLAAYAAGCLNKIHSIKIRVGSKDFNPSPTGKFYLPYSAQTIIEELTLKPWIFCGGKFQQIMPRTGWEHTLFPEPLGKVWTLWTRHSEIATLPLSLKHKGLTYCDFKVGFDREFVEEVMTRLKAGWTIKNFNALVGTPDKPNDCEVSRVIVDDMIVDCHAKAQPEWQASAGDIDTACPPSIVAQMIVDGVINQPGVYPPEIAVPIQPFFAELKKRGLEIKISR